MVNDEQLGVGRVKLVQQLLDGEGRVGRSGNCTEPVRSPGGDGEFDMVRSEESDTVIVADVPAGFHDIGKSVGASSDFLKMVAPSRVVVDEPWRGLRANRPIRVVIIEEELGNGHVGGNVRDRAIGGDKFLDGCLGGHS